jgi:hypothetical protein
MGLKQQVYSKAAAYPMKRVDFDPNGNQRRV